MGLVGVDAEVAGDHEGFLHDVDRDQVGVVEQCLRRRVRVRTAGADRDQAVLGFEHVAVAGDDQRRFAIGSGGAYAQAAAKALLDHTDMSPAQIVKRSLEIAGDLCIYTNQSHTIEVL